MSKALKLGPYLKEFRFHLCQNSNESLGFREFIQKHYVPLKKSNPQFPMLVRECRNVEPKIYARYEFGKETSVSVKNLGSDKIFEVLQKLATATK
ncbi:NADH dehydrogenase [ubiquinone] 1 alpha subcomplex subunit 2 [Parasteatoda tepidariorum]|uniref:NADH dehydrogenase [ubiquinone] 1 alpha subcomplex subunit 2 n=1 Tax=Parasteatoda tepidariorum TaxID=114398 RepID=UPI00077F8EB2|nr:NADH dehydrogenase [ubiquinone] 1 alpha subcomplex subunit 2 [Parasteatoda tepidariorum]